MKDKNRNARRIRYAVVGLGHLAQVAVLPAFSHLQDFGDCVRSSPATNEKQRILRDGTV